MKFYFILSVNHATLLLQRFYNFNVKVVMIGYKIKIMIML